MAFLNLKKKPENINSNLTHTIIVSGIAGEGIKSSGEILSHLLIKHGFNVFTYDEYPSLIKGGQNCVNITFSNQEVYSPSKEIDLLIALNREAFEKHKGNLKKKALVLFDPKDCEITNEDSIEYDFEPVEVSAEDLITKSKLERIVKNTVLVSAASKLLGLSEKKLTEIVSNQFKDKRKALSSNLKAIKLGYHSLDEFANTSLINLEFNNKYKKTQYLTGNNAVCLGAIKGGLGFYAAYPMTPASTLLDFLSIVQREYNLIAKQTEDEIAAINMAIGASFAGARAMVGTSGGGFSLMVEGLGLAAITETPLTLIISQRPGPATGMPTWTSQSDLQFILHASQDEFPRIILTPTDINECFELTFLALNLAEKFQLPVFVLIDKFLSESTQSLKLNTKSASKINRGLLLTERLLSRINSFERFEDTPEGVSPRSLPGMENGIFLANSDESDAKGFTSESHENRQIKIQKRFRKLENILQEMPSSHIYGNPKAKVGIICWGSTKLPLLEAIRRLQIEEESVKTLCLNHISPFPTLEVEKFIDNCKEVLIIEGNYTGQLQQLIKLNTGIEITKKLNFFDGKILYPDEIKTFIESHL